MANGEACIGAIKIIEEAQAELCGIAIIIEKAFQSGRKKKWKNSDIVFIP